MRRRALAAACLAFACAREPSVAPPAACPAFVSDGRLYMGTVLEISLCGPDRTEALRWLDALYAEVDRLERIFTRYESSSALSRVNARAGQGPVPAPPELLEIVAGSLELHALTRGAFDVSVGPLIAVWSEAGRTARLPDEQALADARACTGAEQVAVDPHAGTLALARACASLDLGGVAKGWTLDRLGEALRKRGVAIALLDFGGSSLLALGAPPGTPGWGILAGDAGELRLRDQSLSVSGSLGQYAEIGGRRYGHVIDPRSGRALAESHLAFALAANGERAEALSKALLVLGPEEGIALLSGLPDANGMLLGERGERWVTPGFDAASAFRPLRAGQVSESSSSRARASSARSASGSTG